MVLIRYFKFMMRANVILEHLRGPAKNLCMCVAEIWPLYTGAGLNLGVRVLDEV